MENAVITGSGCYLPTKEVQNMEFIENPFCFDDGRRIQDDNTTVISKFEKITGIKARRYVENDQSCSEIAAIAGERAIEDAKIDREDLDLIIVAHNFGDVVKGSIQTDIVPSISARVKHRLGIKNEFCVAYDVIFGCPGWVQGVILANMYIKSGQAKKCLIIGSEVLSRVVDPSDRDTMIFADGAGATVIEAKEKENGIVAHASVSHSEEELGYLNLGKTYNHFIDSETKYIKMKGNKIYQYALTKVPAAMKHCFDQTDWDIDELDKILIHQANEKMDEAIIKRFYRKFGKKNAPVGVMPMTIAELGNSSVATVPTLYDMIMKGQLEGHSINPGDKILFASVGAGMNINCVAYVA